MLTYELKGNILHVEEYIFSFTRNKVSHWYYDIQNWKVSSFGKLGDKPDRPMSAENKIWVQKHYLAKVGIALPYHSPRSH